MVFYDLTNQRFHKLKVIGRAHTDNRNQIYWHCLCDCGTTKERSCHALKESRRADPLNWSEWPAEDAVLAVERPAIAM